MRPLGAAELGSYSMEKKEVVVTVRLNREEVGKLDQLTVGQYSRSQVMRIVLQDFLQKPEKEQRRFITSRAFG